MHESNWVFKLIDWENNLQTLQNFLNTIDSVYDVQSLYQKPCEIKENIAKIYTLQNHHPQKSMEWHAFRHNMITASDVHRALGSESSLNSLVREKAVSIEDKKSNVSSLMHGVSFEPIAKAYYEKTISKCNVEEFSCVQHPLYSFLGASPDGIVVNEKSEYYGRLLEIKCPISRKLCETKHEIPLKYFMQMQMQMEVTNLNFCDYLEVNFQTVEEFVNPEVFSKCGITIQFANELTSENFYSWIFLDDLMKEQNEERNVKDVVEDWTSKEIVEHLGENPEKSTMLFVSRKFWEIEDVFLCTIPRERKWFEKQLPKLQSAWQMIEDAREQPELIVPPKKKKKSSPTISIIDCS
jgi:putative phage-type endonuclease